MATAIQWTDETWNPVTGCQKVSPGCKHCYAEAVAHRFWGDRRFTDVRVHPDRLGQPLRWRMPRRVFVNSMSDLFHEDVPDEFIGDVLDVAWRAERHTFQILTKRPERMREIMSSGDDLGVPLPLPNVWLGVSVEDQERADERIPVLLDTPAAVRFLSCEPLLGPVDLMGAGGGGFRGQDRIARGFLIPNGCHTIAGGEEFPNLCACGGAGTPRIDWVIVGGESGLKARPMDLAWARSLVEQGRAAGVPVFVKQLGRRPEDEGRRLLIRDAHGGVIYEWPDELRVREFPGEQAALPADKGEVT